MITIERVLCPTDLSPESDEALRYGVALALTYEAKLYVCHCVEASPLGDTSGSGQIHKLFEDSIRSHIRHLDPEALDWESLVVEGDPATAITHEAAERRVDLIVMRSRRRPYAAALLGSTAEALCRTAPCPVLVTHPEEREWAGAFTHQIGLKRILVAHDFSNNSELALSYGLTLAQEYQAEVHLIHVLPSRAQVLAPELAMLPSGGEAAFHLAARRLEQAVTAEVHLWCDVKQVIREGQPYREVLGYAKEHNVDLVCLGASGTGFGMWALFGSNADRVLRQAPCPVLIARPLRPASLTPTGV